MPSDRSRRTDRPAHGYTGVVAQQGRVILDRDFNAGQGLTAARIAADALDFVGPCGTPDDGFRISLPGQSPPEPFWSPPVTPPPESPPVSVGGSLDFLIAPGTMYVGGERVWFPGEQDGRAITYSYFDQPDDPAPPQPNPDVVRELAYLDLTEQEVSAVEDPDLLEVALGGPDTTQRLKLLRRVRRMPAPATCAAAWDWAVKRWTEAGWQFDPATNRLTPAARLLVGFTQDASADNPCDPVATGGYLGADNQLIRVRIAGSKAAPMVLWGYDNASFLYPVTSVSPDGTTLTLAYDPPDALHVPQAKQVVEILQTAAVLATEPNETDPGGPQPLLRVVAEQNGNLRTLAQPYVSGTPGGTIVLATALPMSVAQSPLPLFLRVWQAELPLTVGAATELTDPVTGTSTGVTVTITSAGALADGAYWLIAVRPATPQGAYPESLLKTPQPPDGPRRWACPLAVIDWGTGIVTDCRSIFDNLVTLTARKPGCCTVSIGPQDVTATASLQMLIDQAVSKAQTVTVCLSPGTYSLPSPLRLTRQHDGLTLESCGGPALLRADPNVAASQFVDGLVVLTGANAVTLRGLTLHVPYATTAFEQGLPGSYMGFGVHAQSAKKLTLQDCVIEFPEFAASQLAILAVEYLFAAAVYLQGDCGGLTVCGCKFSSAIAPTYTAIPIQRDNSALATMQTKSVVMERLVGRPSASSTQAPPSPQPAPAVLTEAVERFEATFQPASPPPTRAVVFADRAAASRDILAATRAAALAAAPATASRDILAAAPAPKRPPVIATAGVLAFYLPQQTRGFYFGAPEQEEAVPCELGDATIRDTKFSDLTFATWIFAAASTLRLQDNIATGCVAGFWYFVPDPAPPEAPAGGSVYYSLVLYFEEFLLYFLVLVASLPPGARIVEPAATEFTAFVTGNRIDPGGTPNPSVGAAGHTAALYLSLSAATDPTQGGGSATQGAAGELPVAGPGMGTQSVIVAANHFRTVSGLLPAPAALLALPYATPCSITGNVILNVQVGISGAAPGFSLWLIAAGTDRTATADSLAGTISLSATGNAFFGWSNLAEVPRYGSNPLVGWNTYNADFPFSS